MDEKLQRQIIRQLKILNIWITIFGILILLAIGAIGFMLFQVITFAQSTAQQLNQFQQGTSEQFNVEKQVCGSEGQLSQYLRSQTNVCDNNQ